MVWGALGMEGRIEMIFDIRHAGTRRGNARLLHHQPDVLEYLPPHPPVQHDHRPADERVDPACMLRGSQHHRPLSRDDREATGEPGTGSTEGCPLEALESGGWLGLGHWVVDCGDRFIIEGRGSRTCCHQTEGTAMVGLLSQPNRRLVVRREQVAVAVCSGDGEGEMSGVGEHQGHGHDR